MTLQIQDTINTRSKIVVCLLPLQQASMEHASEERSAAFVGVQMEIYGDQAEAASN